jgi:hypothetical protein
MVVVVVVEAALRRLVVVVVGLFSHSRMHIFLVSTSVHAMDRLGSSITARAICQPP